METNDTQAAGERQADPQRVCARPDCGAPAEPGESWCSDEHHPWGNRRESIRVVSCDGMNVDLGAVEYELSRGLELPESVLRVLAQLGVGPGTATTTAEVQARRAGGAR